MYVYYSFAKEGAADTRTVRFVEFIHMPSGLRNRAEDEELINIDIKNNLITPYETDYETAQLEAMEM